MLQEICTNCNQMEEVLNGMYGSTFKIMVWNKKSMDYFTHRNSVLNRHGTKETLKNSLQNPQKFHCRGKNTHKNIMNL